MPGLKNRLIFRKSGGFLNSEGFLQGQPPARYRKEPKQMAFFRHRIGYFYKNV